MRLSIVVPIYNAEKYLNECIESIKCSDNDFEVILVNDGSTDDSKVICENICKIDGRFKLFNIDNHGVSFARNYGIKKAIGNYIMFVDADDVLKNGWFEKIFDVSIDEDVVYINSQIKVDEPKKEILKYILGVHRPCIAGPVSKLYRRNFLLENTISFNEKIINGEDMLFNVEALNKLETCRVLNKTIYLYRQSNTSCTKTFNSSIFQSDVLFHKRLAVLLKNLDYENKENLMLFCKNNAVIMLLNRLITLNSYREFKDNLAFLKNDIYSDVFECKQEQMTAKYRIIVKLLKLKMYFAVYFVLKLKNKTRKYNAVEDYFIEI